MSGGLWKLYSFQNAKHPPTLIRNCFESQAFTEDFVLTAYPGNTKENDVQEKR